jgi:hypothetical protein
MKSLLGKNGRVILNQSICLRQKSRRLSIHNKVLSLPREDLGQRGLIPIFIDVVATSFATLLQLMPMIKTRDEGRKEKN